VNSMEAVDTPMSPKTLRKRRRQRLRRRQPTPFAGLLTITFAAFLVGCDDSTSRGPASGPAPTVTPATSRTPHPLALSDDDAAAARAANDLHQRRHPAGASLAARGFATAPGDGTARPTTSDTPAGEGK
jgi:hypothetical protein